MFSFATCTPAQRHIAALASLERRPPDALARRAQYACRSGGCKLQGCNLDCRILDPPIEIGNTRLGVCSPILRQPSCMHGGRKEHTPAWPVSCSPIMSHSCHRGVPTARRRADPLPPAASLGEPARSLLKVRRLGRTGRRRLPRSQPERLPQAAFSAHDRVSSAVTSEGIPVTLTRCTLRGAHRYGS